MFKDVRVDMRLRKTDVDLLHVYKLHVRVFLFIQSYKFSARYSNCLVIFPRTDKISFLLHVLESF